MKIYPGIKTFILMLIFLHLAFQSQAQKTALNLSLKEVDLGKIAAIVYPAKTIEFTNQGKEKLAILLIEKGPNVKVNFQRKFFQPGEKGLLSVYYEPRQEGPIQEEMKIYTNLDPEPILLTVKGTCVSIQECFPDIHNLNKRNVLVINKLTQAPVAKAEVGLIRNHQASNQVNIKMDNGGKALLEMPIGLYGITCQVSGYENYEKELFVPKTYPNVVIELTPIQEQKLPDPIKGNDQAVLPISTNPENKTNTATNKVPLPKITSVDLPEDRYAANNIVLLLDVSGSMNEHGKFKLLQQSVNNLAMILRSIDNVSVITYAGTSKVILSNVPGNDKDKIISSIQDLVPHGSTQGVKGLNTAYEMATQQFISKGNNQVILATDGEFSEKGVTDEDYQKFISGYTQKGIRLSILGFGKNKAAIDRMNKMTMSGDGSYIQVDLDKIAKNTLVNEIKDKSLISDKK